MRLNLSRERVTPSQLQVIHKQKPLKITTSQNPCTQSYPSMEETQRLSRKQDALVRKRVTFMEKSGMSRPKTDSAAAFVTDPFQSAGHLVLSTQNLELYNSMANTAQLSAPSDEDDRIVNWIQERQIQNRLGQLGIIYDDIPEVEENSLPDRDDNTVHSTIPYI